MTGKIEKVWGTTEPLVVTPLFELHRLVIKPHHRCSFHVHRFKHNAFYVLDGFLWVDTVDADHTEPEALHLWAGHTLTIRPGVHHQFRTGTSPCVALEIYFTEPLSEDIIRRNVGGPVGEWNG